MTGFAERYDALRARVDAAAVRVGRDPTDVTILAVSKKQPIEAVREAVACGLRAFGENYAQELVVRREEINEPVHWHFIGKLQRNKVKAVIGAALIHAVDSQRLIDEIGKRAAAANHVQDILIAVNLAGESQKSGVEPKSVGALIAHCQSVPSLECRGLMSMPPLPQVPEDSRPYYRELRELRAHLETEHGPLPVLSMGTTGDFEVAVEEGATLVRVGTALFGPRPAV